VEKNRSFRAPTRLESSTLLRLIIEGELVSSVMAQPAAAG